MNPPKNTETGRGRFRGAARFIAVSLTVQALACYLLSAHFALFIYSLSVRFKSNIIDVNSYNTRNYYAMREYISDGALFVTGIRGEYAGSYAAELSYITFLKRTVDISCVLFDKSYIKVNYLNYYLITGNENVLSYAASVVGGGEEFKEFMRGIAALNGTLPPARRLSFAGIGPEYDAAATSDTIGGILENCSDYELYDIVTELLRGKDLAALYVLFTEGLLSEKAGEYNAERFYEIFGDDYRLILMTLFQYTAAEAGMSEIEIMTGSYELLRKLSPEINTESPHYIQCGADLLSVLCDTLPQSVIGIPREAIIPMRFYYQNVSGTRPDDIRLPFVNDNFSVRLADTQNISASLNYLEFTMSRFGARLPAGAPKTLDSSGRFFIVITN